MLYLLCVVTQSIIAVIIRKFNTRGGYIFSFGTHIFAFGRDIPCFYVLLRGTS